MDTTIEWTQGDDSTPGKTWNPVAGCTRVSNGCTHCYAERMAGRFCGPGQPYEGLVRRGPNGARWTGEVRLVPERLADPLKWRKPRRVFVNSMSDLFHEGLTNEEIAAVFGVMAACPQHTFQILTKRARRMREWFAWIGRNGENLGVRSRAIGRVGKAWNPFTAWGVGAEWPLENCWLGVSVEDQAHADARIPHLLETPAAVRFLSVEPMLGPVDLRSVWMPDGDALGECLYSHRVGAGISWVICGAESGPGARPMDEDWVRSLRDQCVAAGVPFFFKQKLEHGRKVSLPLLDGQRWQQWPEDETPTPLRCKQCGGVVEEERRCYATPVCFACLPPPKPLPVARRRLTQDYADDKERRR